MKNFNTGSVLKDELCGQMPGLEPQLHNLLALLPGASSPPLRLGLPTYQIGSIIIPAQELQRVRKAAPIVSSEH